MDSLDPADASISTSALTSASSTSEAWDAPTEKVRIGVSPYFPHDILQLELSKQEQIEKRVKRPKRIRTRKAPSGKIHTKPTPKRAVKRPKKSATDKSRKEGKLKKPSNVPETCPLCMYDRNDQEKRRVHGFPKDAEYRAKWTDICREVQPGFAPSKKSYICEMHFSPDDMHAVYNKRSTKNPVYRLNEDAVPLQPYSLNGPGVITGLPQLHLDGLNDMSPSSPEVSMLYGKENVCAGLYCEDCAEFSEEPCWFHTTYVENTPVVPFALASLPDCLMIDLCPDSCEKGVFTKNVLEAQTVFGPMVGALCSTSPNKISPFACEDKSGYGIFKQLHMDSDDCCNWMRYVRFAENKKDQNLMACVKNDEIVFVTTTDVRPGQELKVWYSRSYAEMVKEPGRRQGRECEPRDIANLVLLVTPDQSHLLEEVAQSDGNAVPTADAQVTFDEQELLNDSIPNRASPRRSKRLGSKTPEIKNPKRIPQKSKLVLSRKGQQKLPIAEPSITADGMANEGETQPVSDDFNAGEPVVPVPEVEKKPRRRWKECRKARKDPTSIIKHPCLECLRHFPTEQILALHRHVHSKDMSGTVRECPECKEVFDSFRKLVEHVKTHGTKYVPREKCPHCELFIALNATDPHMRRMHPEHFVEGLRSFPCPLCGETFPSWKLMTEHRSEKHTFCRQCIICAQMFTYTIGLNRHVLIHKEPDGFHCKMCPLIFPSYRHLRTHHRRHHDITELKTCTVCQKTVRGHYDFSLHMLQHTNDYSYKCDICDKAFNHPTVLASHRREIHNPDTRKKIKQRYQEKVSTGQRKKYVNPRQVVEYDDFPFKCTICRQGFLVEGKLTRHQRRLHTEPDGT